MRVFNVLLMVSGLHSWLGCGNTATTLGDSVVLVAVDSVATAIVEFGATLRIRATVRNQSSHDVYINACSPTLDREESGRWATVWASVCGPGGAGNTTVKAGEEFVILISALAANGENWSPTELVGRYRLRLAVFVEGRDSAESVVSAPFDVSQ